MNLNERENSIIKGTFFTVSIRWIDRLVGMLSVFVLARILTPQDFGIVAIATLSVGFANVLFNFGVNVSLIKIQEVTQDHYDTAWTIKLLQSLVVTLALLLLTPFIAEHFNAEQSLKPLFYLAFLPLLTGLQNIGLVDFHKRMHFDAEFRYLVSMRISGFVVTIALAWMLRSYWALVIGSLSTAFIGTVLSYIVHPMRPVFSLKKWKDILSISQWMLLKNIGEYLNNNLQNFFVGRWFPSSVLGSYTLAVNISVMPSAELLAPFNRVLFPVFSKHQNNWPELKRLFLHAQSLQILIAMPASAGLALVAQEAVPLFLGSKWLAVTPFVQVLSWIGFFGAITATSGYLMLVLGYVRLNVMVSFIQVVVFVSLALFVASGGDAIEIAWLRLAVGVVGAIFTFVLVRFIFPVVSVGDFARNSFRPILGVMAMAASIYYIDPYLVFSLPLILLFKVFLGFIVYVLTILIVWILCKKPCGAESYLRDKFLFMIKSRLIRHFCKH